VGECKRGRNGSEHDKAPAASVPNARAGDAEGGVTATAGTSADTESSTPDRIADARLAQIDPERPEVNGFAVEKAHLEEVRGQNLLISITRGGSNRGIPSKNLKKLHLCSFSVPAYPFRPLFWPILKEKPNFPLGDWRGAGWTRTLL
jgi:hypothetical protein